MFNIKALSVLMKITSKLDLTPVVEKLKTLDIFTEAKSIEDAKAQLTKEKAGIIAAEIIAALVPQLDSVAEFLPELVAAYKGVPVEEAEKLDALEVATELMGDKGIVNFFKTALQKKVEQKP